MDRVTPARSLRRERREQDRRGREAFRFPERRTGFDRRLTGAAGFGLLRERVVQGLRDAERDLFGVLVVVNVLNAADLVLTIRALGAGATEANPVLAAMFAEGAWMAGVFKLSVFAGMSFLIWKGRRYRRLIEMSLVMLAVYSALIVYQVFGALWL